MLTIEQKAAALRSNGYDPSQYTVDDDGNVFSNTQSPQNVQPTIGTNELLTKPQAPISTDTPLTTGVKSFASAAPSALATGVGAAAGVAATPWIAGSLGLAPETGGVSLLGLLVPLLSGIGAGVGTSKLQKMLEPESMQQDVAASQAQNPLSATAGSLATLPLGGFSPSPTSAVKGIGTIAKLLARMPATEGEMSNLANVGLGAGVGVGGGAAQDILAGKNPLDIKSILENAAIGGLFNKPNAIGNALGMGHPVPYDMSSQIRDAAMSGQPLDVSAEVIPQPEVQAKPTLNPLDVLRGVSSSDVGASLPRFKSSGEQVTYPNKVTGQPSTYKELITPRKNAQASAADIDMLTRESADVQDRTSVIEDYKKQLDYERMLHAQASDALRQTVAAKDELARQNYAEKQSNLAASALDIQNALQGGIARPEVRPEPLATTPLGRDIPKDFTGVTEQNNAEVQSESLADLAARKQEGLSDRYQAPIERTEFEKQMMEKARTAGLPDKPTNNLFSMLNNWFQQKRGVGLRLSDKVKGMGETAVPTDAKSSVLGYLSHINPNKATIDTLFHEPFHVFYNRLKYSDRPSDQRLVGKFENLVKNLPEYQAKFGNDPHGVEEYITSNQGWEAVRRHMMNDESGLKSYFKDFSSYLKTRFSNSASEADFRRIMDYRFTNDPVWTKQHGNQLSGGLTHTVNVNDFNQRLQEEREKASAQRIGTQEGFGNIPAQDLYNVNQDTHDTEKNIKYVKGSTIGQKTAERLGLDLRKQDDRQTPPDDEMVKTAIQNLVHGTDTATINEADANELHRALVEQVDWRRAPEVKNLLEQPNFDVLDPDSWAAIKKTYDYTIGQKKTMKQSVEQQTKTVQVKEPNSIEDAIKRRNVEPDGTVYYQGKKVNPTNEYMDALLPHLERKIAEEHDKLSELGAAKRANPQANTQEVRKHLLDDARANTWDEAIAQHKAILKDTQQYTEDIKLANKQYNSKPKATRAELEKVPVDEVPAREPKAKAPKEVTQQAKNPAEKYVEPKEEIPSFDKTSALIGHTAEKTPERRERELFDAKQRWKAVEDTENPKASMDTLADRWRKNPDVNRRQEIAAMIDYLSSKYGVEKPELEGLRKQDERQAELLNEKDIEAKSGFAKMREAVDNPDKGNREAFNAANDESGERGQKERKSFVPLLTSRFDKISEKFKDSPAAKYVSDQLHKFAGETEYQKGQIGNKLIQATRGYNQSAIERVYRHQHQIDDTGKSTINLSTKEQTLADRLTEILREPRKTQIELGLNVKSGNGNFRTAGIKPEGYMFNIPDMNVLHEWQENPASTKSHQYDNAYIEHQIAHGMSEDEAKITLADYKNALGNRDTKDVEFGALRKAEGNGLPWELVDKNFNSAAERYSNRAARDLSYFKHIQSDPKMRNALNIRDQFGNRPAPSDVDPISNSKEVKDAMRSVNGIANIPQTPRINAFARAVSNTIMGPGTAVRNILNIPSFISNYVSPSQMPLAFKALANINESKVRAFESNAVKTNFQDFDAAGYSLKNPDPVINLLDKFSQYARKYQGRDFSDKFEGQYFYSLGELLATDNIAKAKNGDKTASKWLDKFGDIVDGRTDKLLKGIVTPDDISRVAKRFVDATRGTYGAEGLPSWALEGALAPFTALSRFGIEKSNRIYQDVINPLKEGNIVPLLSYTLSSLGVGIATEKLNELLSNKRGNDPTIAEAVASQKPEEMFAKAVGLLQLSTFAGVVSDGAKLATDAALGRSNLKQNTLSYPMYDFVTNTLGSNIAQAAEAIRQKEDPFQVMAKLAQTISTSSVQSLRYLNNNFVDSEGTKRKERFRDLSTYESMNGMKSGDDAGSANEFMNLGAKKFKEEEDIRKASEELPGLVNRAISKSTTDGMIDPEKLKAQLESLKSNNYQTMPSPDSMPRRFFDYLNYLIRTQGQEKANETLTNYLRQRAVNSVKSEMVPSI